MQVIVCPTCSAMTSATSNRTPHEGKPCPTSLALREAEIEERLAHAELLRAQRDATVLGTQKRR